MKTIHVYMHNGFNNIHNVFNLYKQFVSLTRCGYCKMSRVSMFRPDLAVRSIICVQELFILIKDVKYNPLTQMLTERNRIQRLLVLLLSLVRLL